MKGEETVEKQMVLQSTVFSQSLILRNDIYYYI